MTDLDVDPDRPQRYAGLTVRLLTLGRALGATAAAVGVVVLVGYRTRSARIVRLAPSLPPMYPNAAILFVLSGASVYLARARSARLRHLSNALAVAVVAGALLVLGLHIAGARRTWVEGLWPDHPFVVATTPVPGRPVVETVVAFVMIGVAVLLQSLRRAPRSAQAAAIAATAIGFAAIAGYVVGVDRARLGTSLIAVGMALHTSIGITLLGLACLVARPRVGLVGQLTSAGPGGRLSRRLIAVVIAFPLLLAVGNAALVRALPDATLAQSLFLVLQVAAMGVLVLLPAAAIDQLDRLAAGTMRAARRELEADSERDRIVRTISDQLVSTPTAPMGWSLAVRQEPAFGELAGDALVLAQRDQPGYRRLLVAVLDVAGHGTVPALQAYRLRVEAAALWREGLPPGAIMTHLGASVAGLRTICTGVLIEVDLDTGELAYVNAGHPAMVLASSSGSRQDLAATGPLLGLVGTVYEPRRLTVERGDILVVFTDGVTEARSPGGAILGDARVRRLVGELASLGVHAIADACMDAAHEHASVRLPDDALVVALGRS